MFWFSYQYIWIGLYYCIMSHFSLIYFFFHFGWRILIKMLHNENRMKLETINENWLLWGSSKVSVEPDSVNSMRAVALLATFNCLRPVNLPKMQSTLLLLLFIAILLPNISHGPKPESDELWTLQWEKSLPLIDWKVYGQNRRESPP